MKRIVFVIFLIISVAHFGFSQNSVAKVKYEEAEEAFNENNFTTTLSKLDEAESILGKTNPKILYLRIFAQYKLLEKNQFDNFTSIQTTRGLISSYLKNYENLPSNEDKYREIYNISEKIKSYPNSQQELDEQKRIKQAALEMIKQNELNAKNKYDEAFKNYVYNDYYKTGMDLKTKQTTYSDVWGKIKRLETENGYTRIQSKSYYAMNLYVNNNDVVCGYQASLFDSYSKGGDDNKYTKGYNEINNLIAKYSSLFGFEPKRSTSIYNGGWISGNKEDIVWQKGTKKIWLEFVTGIGHGVPYSIITIHSLD